MPNCSLAAAWLMAGCYALNVKESRGGGTHIANMLIIQRASTFGRGYVLGEMATRSGGASSYPTPRPTPHRRFFWIVLAAMPGKLQRRVARHS